MGVNDTKADESAGLDEAVFSGCADIVHGGFSGFPHEGITGARLEDDDVREGVRTVDALVGGVVLRREMTA